jgi:hypothetical protein
MRAHTFIPRDASAAKYAAAMFAVGLVACSASSNAQTAEVRSYPGLLKAVQMRNDANMFSITADTTVRETARTKSRIQSTRMTACGEALTTLDTSSDRSTAKQTPLDVGSFVGCDTVEFQ